jgi:hypothetical protein
MDIKQTHSGSGDNVAGDKTTNTYNPPAAKEIPKWLKYLGAVVAILGIIAGMIWEFIQYRHLH